MKIYQIFTHEEAAEIVADIDPAKWGRGLARTKELTGTVKQNLEILAKDDVRLADIGRKIVSNPVLQQNHIPYKIHPPKFSKYSEGAHYKRHTDAPWMAETRTDLSCTLWLTDDYEGGELAIDGKLVKGKAGQCVIYECGKPHEVKPVTKGERICAVTWIQSRVRDPQKRELITEMRKLLSQIEGPALVDGSRIHSALLRMWID